MKKLCFFIFAVLIFISPSLAFSKEYESKINLINMPREKIFEMADSEFIPMTLKESMTDKTLQKKIFNYCQRRGLKYTDLLINLYKESNFKGDTLVETDDGYYAIGMGCITVPKEKYEENKHLRDPWENAKRTINIMCDIKSRYETTNLEETIICYQYGYWYLDPFRKKEYIPPKISWYDRIEEAREYLKKQITKVLLKQINKNKRIIESNIVTYNTHFPKDFFEKY